MTDFPKTLKALYPRIMGQRRLPLLYSQEAPRPRTILVKGEPFVIRLDKYITGVSDPRSCLRGALYVAAHDRPWHSLEEIFRTKFYQLRAYNHITGEGHVCLGRPRKSATMENFWMTSFLSPLYCCDPETMKMTEEAIDKTAYRFYNNFPFRNNAQFPITETRTHD